MNIVVFVSHDSAAHYLEQWQRLVGYDSFLLTLKKMQCYPKDFSGICNIIYIEQHTISYERFKLLASELL